jgi:methylene-tetrahydromethanopterin dehydrogenase
MAKNILHMMTPLAHMSPFDVNMAIDAGYDATVSYTRVSLEEITGLVHDAMFSRSPRDAARTGVFIGGKDAILALDMLDAAGKALLKPFEISLFADPAGSFTTAAAMIAVVAKTLKEKKGRELRGAAASVFGATGVVGTASGVIAALEGASVAFVGREGTERAARHAAEVNRRFSVNIGVADGRRSSRRPRSRSSRRKPASRCSTPLGSPVRRNCWSPRTSTRCRRRASTDWMRTPTACRSASAALSASAPWRSVT